MIAPEAPLVWTASGRVLPLLQGFLDRTYPAGLATSFIEKPISARLPEMPYLAAIEVAALPSPISPSSPTPRPN